MCFQHDEGYHNFLRVIQHDASYHYCLRVIQHDASYHYFLRVIQHDASYHYFLRVLQQELRAQRERAVRVPRPERVRRGGAPGRPHAGRSLTPPPSGG